MPSLVPDCSYAASRGSSLLPRHAQRFCEPLTLVELIRRGLGTLAVALL